MGTILSSEVISMAQRRLVDTADDAYLSTESGVTDALDYLNEGSKRLALGTLCCQEVSLATITQTSIPTAFSDIAATHSSSDALSVISVYKIELLNTTTSQYEPLRKANFFEMRNIPVAATLIPTRWSIFAEKLYWDLYPGVTTSFNVYLYFSYVPIRITDASVAIKVPDMCAPALAKYVEFCCRVSDRDAGLANGAWQEFESMRLELAATMKERMMG